VHELREFYDIVIIGAGPAGLNAGMHIINAGFDKNVLLVDKITPWDHPIACAEGVGKLGFEGSVKVRKSWIRQEIKYARFHAPDGSVISYKDKNGGYIINRALMQKEMASQLESSGIQCLFNFKVLQIQPPDKGLRTVVFENGRKCKARVIIDASGPLCCFGKEEKINSKPGDLEPSYFAWVENIDIEQDHIHIYAGKELAPGGYAWVFPRGENAANIGIVLGRHSVTHANLRVLLDNFLSRHFPSVKIIQRFAGSIPCGFKKVPIAIPGFIKTGDAANTVNPISRAGISEALLCGGLAGDAALKMVGKETNKQLLTICNEYQNEWFKRRGNRHFKLARVKNSLLVVPDEDYNNGTRLLSSIPREELTMSKIFRASLGRFPRLVWALRHLM
jgi:digeranylgeranylglycerophospholipid reductase